MPIPLGKQSSSSFKTPTPFDIVERWVYLQQEMNQLKQFPSSKSSFAVHSSVNNSSRRAQSAHASPYLQPVESLTVSFAKLLVNQINGASTTSASATNKRRKKNKKTSRNPNSSSVRTPIRNNQPVTQVSE